MRWAAALVLVFGCGARTGLDVPPGVGSDASVDGRTPAPTPGPAVCPGPFNTPVLVANVNTSFDDLCARLSPDELTMWFTSDRGDPRPRPDGWDLYVATRASTSATFGSPQRLASLASNVEDGCPTVTGDGLTIFFQTRRTNGRLEVWSSTRGSTSGDFPPPVKATTLVPADWESWNPYVLPDASALFLTATQPSSAPHLHRSARTGGGFGIPVRIDSLAKQEEQAPVVTPDELSIFFARQGANAGRDFDVVMSVRASRAIDFPADSKVNELSSAGYDFATWISPDGCRAYLTSERTGGPGRDDIWFAERKR